MQVHAFCRPVPPSGADGRPVLPRVPAATRAPEDPAGAVTRTAAEQRPAGGVAVAVAEAAEVVGEAEGPAPGVPEEGPVELAATRGREERDARPRVGRAGFRPVRAAVRRLPPEVEGAQAEAVGAVAGPRAARGAARAGPRAVGRPPAPVRVEGRQARGGEECPPARA